MFDADRTYLPLCSLDNAGHFGQSELVPASDRLTAAAVVAFSAALLIVASVIAVAVLDGVNSNEAFLARIDEATNETVCYQVLDGTSRRDCGPWEEIVDLPHSVKVGSCVMLELHHPLLHFVEVVPCP